MVYDAWSFFAPPLIYLAFAAVMFLYVCGSEPVYSLVGVVKERADFIASPSTSALLDKYKLTALVPVIALFVAALIAYSINRLVFGIAGLLPFNLITSPGSIIAARVQLDPRWQQHITRYGMPSADQLIDYTITKARFEKREQFVSNVDSWQQSAGKAAQLFFFSKFLLVWTIACAALSVTLPDATPFTYKRVALLLILVILFGLFSACRHAYAYRQLAYAKVNAAQVLLSSEIPREMEQNDQNSQDETNKYERWKTLEDRPWWRVGLGLMESWPMLRYYEYLAVDYPRSGNNLWRQGILRNSLNILWFIMGALLVWLLSKLSWWIGCFLFVGYVSVTIIDCLTIGVLLIGTWGRALLVWLKSRLPDDITDLLSQGLLARITRAERQEYWLAAASTRVVEAFVAIILSRMLASYFF